jgi:hypothetical protein
MKPVPNRAPKTRVLIDNGGLGTDNAHIGEWAIGTHQGMAAVRRAVKAHELRTGKQSWAETRTNDDKLGNTQPRVLYGKKTK